MFYSQFILAKKGPLGTIWIAAHLERKLRKNQVTETNIGVSVDSILFPEVPIALRLSGHLLLGVVRIYSRKVNYLFHDCSEALLKIKQAFNSGAVDLPPEAATAPFHSITLPDNFDLDDLELLPDREALFLANSSIDHHVTSREQITLQDTIDDSTYLGSQFGLDERFPDGGAPRLEFDEDVLPVKSPAAHEEETDDKIHGIEDSRRACALDTDSCLPMDALHEATAAPGQDGDEAESEEADQNKHAEGAGREDTSHPGETNAPNIAEDRETHKFGMEQVVPEIEKVLSAEDVPYLEPNIMELAVDADSTVLNAAAPALQVHEEPPLEEDALRSEDIEETPALKQDGANLTSPPDFSADEDLLASILGRSTPSLRLAPTPELPPAKRQKTASKAISRKRKVRLDEATVLHGNEMRHQLSDTSDIRRLRRRAPCTEYEIWSAQRAIQGQLMFDDPLIPGYCESIRRIYHCIFHAGDVKLPDTGRRSMQDKHQLDHEENHESLTLDEEAFDEFAFYDLQGTIDDEQGPKDIQPNQPPAEAKDIQPNQPPAEAIRDTNGGDIPCVETQPVQPEVNEEGEKTELVDVLGQPPTTGNGGPSDAVVQAEQMLERDGDVKNDSVSYAEANGEGPEVLNPAAQEVEEADETPEGLGFLTDSKDEENDHDDRAQDNTGWSIRTRAVCQYLRTTFEAMESSRDGTKIGLERLLQGKTRRESARMFFESLVLKTKDYINVEQTAPFANIYITPRARLMKVDI